MFEESSVSQGKLFSSKKHSIVLSDLDSLLSLTSLLYKTTNVHVYTPLFQAPV